MAFFLSRKGGDDSAATARQPAESIEAMRRRAKHRLIGACVLVLVGVVGFPLLFDTQPRPISVDIPIEIPDRNKARPLSVPAAQLPSASGSVTQAPAPAPSASPAPAPAPAPAAAPAVAKAEPTPAPAPAAPPAPKQEAKPESKPDIKQEAKQEAKPANDASKAQALLEGKPFASTPVISEGRYVVQVGAFSDTAKARETRVKLERAGMKTYTQVVETKEGKRIRVRLGPFATRSDAEKAAERAKGLDLQPAVLTL